MTLATLQQYLKSVKTLSTPSCWRAALPTIEAERAHFEKILAAGKAPIYGGNTRVGHRDLEQLTSDDIQAFQQDFLNSHTIGDAPWYSDKTARHISYAKMYALCAGGSGISRALYEAIASNTVSTSFTPQIPQHCTYSCGDVIPGAHWAKAILAACHPYQPAAGEMMALLNGSFIHVGYTLSLTDSLTQLGTLLVETTRLNNNLVQANRVNFATSHQPYMQSLLDYVSAGIDTHHSDYTRQDPISVRATPQVLETFVDAMRSLYQQLDYHLRTPSNNPLFSTDIDYPLSQASFLAPSLSIKTEAVIEAILFALWASVNRTQYLLSGQIDNIPQDGSNANSALQFIQYPKLMMSQLERCRQHCGRRIFAAGTQTSNGIEDLWTYGVNTTEQLAFLCTEGTQLLATELYITARCAQLFGLSTDHNSPITQIIQQASSYQSAIANLIQLAGSVDMQKPASILSQALLSSPPS